MFHICLLSIQWQSFVPHWDKYPPPLPVPLSPLSFVPFPSTLPRISCLCPFFLALFPLEQMTLLCAKKLVGEVDHVGPEPLHFLSEFGNVSEHSGTRPFTLFLPAHGFFSFTRFLLSILTFISCTASFSYKNASFSIFQCSEVFFLCPFLDIL